MTAIQYPARHAEFTAVAEQMTRSQALRAARGDLTLAAIPTPWGPGVTPSHAGMVAYLTAVRDRALELADALVGGAVRATSDDYARELLDDARAYLLIAKALLP